MSQATATTQALRAAAQTVQDLRTALEVAGLPRTSKYNGAEMTGWTDHFGSTGYSIRPCKDGTLQWHVVISGKPHLQYRPRFDVHSGDELHEPVNADSLCPRIRKVFEQMGIKVLKLKCTGWQTAWDDDVDYDIITEPPAWLESPPARLQRH